MTGPEVRVGIVSWNTAGHLDRCLQALPAALGELDAEIVVVDNASDDESVAVARSHRGVEVVAGERNAGYAASMNRALAGTTAPVLIALNPDTVAPAGSLEQLVHVLRDHPEVGVVAPRLEGEDGNLQHSCYRFPSLRLALLANLAVRAVPERAARRWWLEGRSPHDRQELVDWAIGAVHCIRAEAVDGPGVYRERWFMYVEDLDLCWRLSQRGWRTLLVASTTVMHVGNVAGAQAWGEGRTARWLHETYDWYALERGPGRARLYAAINAAGSAARLTVGRIRGRMPAWEVALARAVLPVSLRAVRQPLRLPDVGTAAATTASPPTNPSPPPR